MTFSQQIAVVGSVNADFIAAVGRRPAGGETLLASAFWHRSGGKGANQAAAAARAGANVRLIAAVGDDSLGAREIDALRAEAVDVSSVEVLAHVTTGMAFITVTPDGENSIIVAPGANDELNPEQVLQALLAADAPAIIVLQSEVSRAVVDAAAAWSIEHDARVIFNNGPVIEVNPATLSAADPLVVNQHEALDLCPVGDHSADLAARVRDATGARSVIVTLGSAGVVVCSADGVTSIAATTVQNPIDTTGAGDTFVGALSAALCAGMSLVESARAASAAAAEAVTWVGARPPGPQPQSSPMEKDTP